MNIMNKRRTDRSEVHATTSEAEVAASSMSYLWKVLESGDTYVKLVLPDMKHEPHYLPRSRIAMKGGTVRSAELVSRSDDRQTYHANTQSSLSTKSTSQKERSNPASGRLATLMSLLPPSSSSLLRGKERAVEVRLLQPYQGDDDTSKENRKELMKRVQHAQRQRLQEIQRRKQERDRLLLHLQLETETEAAPETVHKAGTGQNEGAARRSREADEIEDEDFDALEGEDSFCEEHLPSVAAGSITTSSFTFGPSSSASAGDGDSDDNDNGDAKTAEAALVRVDELQDELPLDAAANTAMLRPLRSSVALMSPRRKGNLLEGEEQLSMASTTSGSVVSASSTIAMGPSERRRSVMLVQQHRRRSSFAERRSSVLEHQAAAVRALEESIAQRARQAQANAEQAAPPILTLRGQHWLTVLTALLKLRAMFRIVLDVRVTRQQNAVAWRACLRIQHCYRQHRLYVRAVEAKEIERGSGRGKLTARATIYQVCARHTCVLS